MNIKSLISEDNENVSLGRTAFWITFLIVIYFWIFSEYLPDPTMITALEWLLVYNIGKKVTGAVTDYIVKK